jgi:AraC-like DNA-binding protein
MVASSSAGVPEQQLDSAGRAICPLCTKSIRGNVRTQRLNGRIAHGTCVIQQARSDGAIPERRAPILASAAAAAMIDSVPLSAMHELRSSAAATEEEIRTKSTWNSHHWAVNYAANVSGSADVAAAWVRVANSPALDSMWDDLHGGGRQIKLTGRITGERTLVNQTENIGRELLRSVGVMDSLFSLDDGALIQCDPGTGAQNIHFDQTDRDLADQSITLLFYCSLCLSAALPQQCYSFARQSFLLSPCDTVPSLAETAQSTRVASSLTYRAFDFDAGDSLLFWQHVPHAGTAALQSGEKVCVYLKFLRHGTAAPKTGHSAGLYVRMPTMAPPPSTLPPTSMPAAASSGSTSSSKSAMLRELDISPQILGNVGIGVPGLSRPAAATAISLLHLSIGLQQGATRTAAIKSTAAAGHMSPTTLLSAVREFERQGT